MPLPTIPAHAMGYGGAERFLSQLQGEDVPEDWKGSLNITYKLGPKITDGLSLSLQVTTANSIRRADNVIAILKGDVEPDRYVLLGNHRDAWVYGSIDPSSGTAVMMEVARAMGQLVKEKKWRPRRSIMFCSWGGEEFGLLGSNEWSEQYVKSLGARAVAYINIDIACARYPTQMTQKSAKADQRYTIPGYILSHGKLVGTFPSKPPDLWVGDLGSASDYAPLLQFVGITSLDIRYTYNSSKYKIGSYPLYHTEYETFEAVKTLLDKEFKELRSSALLPTHSSSPSMSQSTPGHWSKTEQTLDKEFGSTLSAKVSNYTDLERIISNFKKDVDNFETAVSKIDRKDPMAIRMINDQLLLLEKAFLDPAGLPSRPEKKHLIFAENANDAYAGSSFPGLVDLLFDIDKLQADRLAERWKEIQHHFSVLLNAIQAAGYTLRDVVKFVEETY
ncbi:N-acetylated-alpha-linked acidic dipeptidase 2-like [Pomacea canaliculata]|uniref:N-acetylated-alpha-linked acidic dipeptidase 2-like n=1 Tax=Pomacea canaliculata TaxID=400727 RepID=UPI000D727DC6|nr:N-acetylated-alpha-linked acidic dipeptidase 2-like [Pomacea canaliculata]